MSFRLWLSKASKERNGQVPSGTSPTHGVPPLASVGSSAIAGDQQFWQRLASSSAAPREMKKGGIPTFLSCGGITVLTSTKKKVRRVLARKSLPRTNQNSPSAFSHQISETLAKTSQMMGWIDNRPNKFLHQNFLRQGLHAKCKHDVLDLSVIWEYSNTEEETRLELALGKRD